MLKHQLFLVLLFSSYFIACKKDDVPDTEGSRLHMTIYQIGNSISSRRFVYDDQNRLSAIYDSSNGLYRHRVFLNYDPQGKLVQVTDANNGMFDGSFIEIVFSFQYDQAGRMTRKAGVSPSGNPIINSYTYDARNRLVADSMYSYWSDKIYSYTTFTYDNNDNVIERKETRFDSGEVLDQSHITYEQSPNPFNKLGQVLYFLTGDEMALSKNNYDYIDNGNNITNYSFEYQHNGLPRKYSRSSSFPIASSMEFKYE